MSAFRVCKTYLERSLEGKCERNPSRGEPRPRQVLHQSGCSCAHHREIKSRWLKVFPILLGDARLHANSSRGVGMMFDGDDNGAMFARKSTRVKSFAFKTIENPLSRFGGKRGEIRVYNVRAAYKGGGRGRRTRPRGDITIASLALFAERAEGCDCRRSSSCCWSSCWWHSRPTAGWSVGTASSARRTAKVSFSRKNKIIYPRVSADRDEAVHRRAARATNNTKQGDMGLSTMSLKQATDNVNRYCTCNENICNCCRDFHIPLVQLKGPGNYRGAENESVADGEADAPRRSRLSARALCRFAFYTKKWRSKRRSRALLTKRQGIPQSCDFRLRLAAVPARWQFGSPAELWRQHINQHDR